MMVIAEIRHAFEGRLMPRRVIRDDAPDTNEYLEALNFQGLNWEMMDNDFLVRNSDALYVFTPEAFCYYLPAFLVHGFERRQIPPFYVDTILNMLDRSPDPDLWDDAFRRRWSILKLDECRVISSWLLALSELPGEIFDRLTLERSFDTIQLLIACR